MTNRSVLSFLLSHSPAPGPGPWPFSSSPPRPPNPLEHWLPLHLTPPCFPGRFAQKQPGLHGNVKTAEKWQLNAAAPHLISTLALTEQIMGNNTPLCCGKMKCFSRRLSCWGGFICYCTSTDLSSLPFFLFLLFWGRDLLPPSLLSFPSSLL